MDAWVLDWRGKLDRNIPAAAALKHCVVWQDHSPSSTGQWFFPVALVDTSIVCWYKWCALCFQIPKRSSRNQAKRSLALLANAKPAGQSSWQVCEAVAVQYEEFTFQQQRLSTWGHDFWIFNAGSELWKARYADHADHADCVLSISAISGVRFAAQVSDTTHD